VAQRGMRWLRGVGGGSKGYLMVKKGYVVTQSGMWWLKVGCGGS
jgi:hypothetical protein